MLPIGLISLSIKLGLIFKYYKLIKFILEAVDHRIIIVHVPRGNKITRADSSFSLVDGGAQQCIIVKHKLSSSKFLDASLSLRLPALAGLEWQRVELANSET